MSPERLSKTIVERMAAADQDIVVWDETLPGFGVRVKPSGVRSYIVQYCNRSTGASKLLTIGRHGPLLSFDQAKKQARALLADAVRGEDPAESQKVARKAPSVSDLAADYLERHAVPKKRPKSVRDDRAMLDIIILPKLGSKKVSSIGRARRRGHSCHDEGSTLPGKSGSFPLVQDVQPCRRVGMAIG